MSWLKTSGSSVHLCEAVSHFNEALDLLERDGTEVDAARMLSDSLNRIQIEWALHEAQEQMAADGSLQAMLAQALCPQAEAKLLDSEEVAELVGLEPEIPATARDRLPTRLAERISVVRGPGFGKAERDKTVSKALIAVQRLLINLLLDKPDERLVIYGTLAPGRANHYVIADLSGVYRDCAVCGRISEVEGLPYFTRAPSGDSLRALLFSSVQLPAKWDDLDLFEGDGYKRRLILASTDDGFTVASIYLSTAEDEYSPGSD